jgi:hypothetical protein
MLAPTPAQIERAYLRAFNASVRLDEIENIAPGTAAHRKTNRTHRSLVARWYRLQRLRDQAQRPQLQEAA